MLVVFDGGSTDPPFSIRIFKGAWLLLEPFKNVLGRLFSFLKSFEKNLTKNKIQEATTTSPLKIKQSKTF